MWSHTNPNNGSGGDLDPDAHADRKRWPFANHDPHDAHDPHDSHDTGWTNGHRDAVRDTDGNGHSDGTTRV